jgi:hypothetical protein
MSPNTIEGLLDDCVDLQSFARGLNRHPRTVRRWMNEPNGLPYTWMGKTTIIHVPTARAWLLSRMRRPNPRRAGARGAAS